jgi:ABC-type multidrug transport system fused ATPase/permease subunit
MDGPTGQTIGRELKRLDPDSPSTEDEEQDDPPFTAPSKEVRAKASRSMRRLISMSLKHWRKLVIVLVLAMVFAGSRLIRAWVFKPLLDDVLVPAANGTLEFAAVEDRIWQLGVLIGMTLVLTPIAMFFKSYLAYWVVSKVRKGVDLDVARKFLHAPLRIHRRGSSGDLLSRALTDARIACEGLVFLYRDVTDSVVMLIGALITMFATSWQLALLSMSTVLPSLFLLRFFGQRIQKQTRRRQEIQGDLSQRLIAILSGIKVIKAFRGHAVELTAFERETERFFKRHMKVIKNRVLAKSSTEALNQFIGVLILGVGAVLTFKGLWEVTIGTLAAFGLILVTSYKPIKTLSMSYTSIVESMASGDRLFQVLDMEEDPPDRPGARRITELSKGIRFRDVHFDYGEGEILRGVDLEVRSGEVIAIVGRTGTGKSTLMDLLLRFHDPTAGSIEIDGVDLRDLKRNSFLDQVAVVTQEPFLFDETIGENIRYGRQDASDEEVREAAKAASADEFIAELPEGYQTSVGEFGLRLSGGQRQRITIARAILCNPAILVFDEATSALDAKTERAVQVAIDALRGQRTIFIVAHRLTTIRHADRIVVLDAGRVAEIGDHETLMRAGGIYRELIGMNVPELDSTSPA